jgi:hypothetical protein
MLNTAADKRNRSTCLSKRPCHPASDTRAAARDECDVALENSVIEDFVGHWFFSLIE